MATVMRIRSGKEVALAPGEGWSDLPNRGQRLDAETERAQKILKEVSRAE